MSTAGLWLYKHLNDKVCLQLSCENISISFGVNDISLAPVGYL